MLKKITLSGAGWRKRIAVFLSCATIIGFCGCKHHEAAKTADPFAAEWVPPKLETADSKQLRRQQLDQLKAFSAAKEQQAVTLAKGANEEVSAEAREFFEAAKDGKWEKVHSIFRGFSRRSPQYDNGSHDTSLRTSYWSTILEVDLAYECVVPMDPRTLQTSVDDIISSIPPGSIYFGGTDPGRGLITAFTKSHANADPFFTLTQNALADGTYLDYLRAMYGDKIQIPAKTDADNCFSEYKADAQRRLEHDKNSPLEARQVKPGESVGPNGQISGQVAVMMINGLIAKTIFDKNPDREFYVEESFPLEWMYPHLEPHGLIMKINREAMDELPEAVVTQDREFWRAQMAGTLGTWLTDDTSVKSVADFADKVYGRKDLSGFAGNREFLECQDAQKFMSKLRSSIAGVYDWRYHHARSDAERNRMQAEADLAFRQAFALCPYSPEAVFRYVNFLMAVGRREDAALVVSTGLSLTPTNVQMKQLLEQLKKM